ncbi:hypothetical protein [Photobacterium alginatilyticum]|uniref:Uncharacterized protein n=1 Tax=Photobacterium alginatilyticum TaxID=1775171 RepID=A0ABW9YT81_9GAMM|nr:hypothetical protein [Photobacterium alginatilyticum]NBI56298.1 hypothetical protein [Photobacterium alginatilyticum]
MVKNFECGKVVQISLSNGKFSYGLVLPEPLVAFSENSYDVPQSDFSEVFGGKLFKIWVMKDALGKNGWSKVGCIEANQIELSEPKFYKFDLISKQFSIYTNGNEIPATKEDCIELECAAVWSKEHVEERLLALSEGRESKWVRSLSAESRV